MLGVNPKILVWARRTAGLTPEEEAQKNRRLSNTKQVSAVDKLKAIEEGKDEPTRSVLVEMARVYRRPLLTFYLSKPPRKSDNRGVDFRRLPAEHVQADDALLDALLRDVLTRQSMVRDVLQDMEEAEKRDFVDSHHMTDGQVAVLVTLRELLGVDLAEYRRQPTSRDAFNLLRVSAEDTGVFVWLISNLGSYHTDIDTDIFRGFAIADDIAPFVIVNPRDAHTAWSFTLLHELTHLLLGQTGVSNARTGHETERFCNDVASEFLLPQEESQNLQFSATADFADIVAEITQFANEKNISRMMVVYRAWRIGRLDQEMFDRLRSTFQEQWLRERKARREQQAGGPNYYVIHRYRLGVSLVNLVRRAMSNGDLTTSKAAKVLGVKPGKVAALWDADQKP